MTGDRVDFSVRTRRHVAYNEKKGRCGEQREVAKKREKRGGGLERETV